MTWFKDNWFYLFCALVILYVMNEKYKWVNLKSLKHKVGTTVSAPKPQMEILMDKTVRVKHDAWHSLCFYTHNTRNSRVTVEVKSVGSIPVDFFISDRNNFNTVLHEMRGYRKPTYLDEREIYAVKKSATVPPRKTVCFGVHHADGPSNKISQFFTGEKPPAAIQVRIGIV